MEIGKKTDLSGYESLLTENFLNSLTCHIDSLEDEAACPFDLGPS